MWAEPCLIEAAKKEYDGVIEEFLVVGEKLFGPYVWGRYGWKVPEGPGSSGTGREFPSVPSPVFRRSGV